MTKRDPYREYRDLEPVRVADAAWERALGGPISEAADAAAHDLQRSAHRPGGGIKPRPRWARDERNKFGNWS